MAFWLQNNVDTPSEGATVGFSCSTVTYLPSILAPEGLL